MTSRHRISKASDLHFHERSEVRTGSDVISELTTFQLKSQKKMDARRKVFVVVVVSENQNKSAEPEEEETRSRGRLCFSFSKKLFDSV